MIVLRVVEVQTSTSDMAALLSHMSSVAKHMVRFGRNVMYSCSSFEVQSIERPSLHVRAQTSISWIGRKSIPGGRASIMRLYLLV